MKNLNFLFFLALGFVISGCTNGPCRPDKPMPENTRTPRLTNPTPTPTPTSASRSKSTTRNSKAKKVAPVATPEQKNAEPAEPVTVLVYRYDGSLQCGMGKAISVDEMEKQLKNIKVISHAKKPDGLMHIQVCGQPTGMVNVYEIPEQNQNDAEALGFRKWDIN